MDLWYLPITCILHTYVLTNNNFITGCYTHSCRPYNIPLSTIGCSFMHIPPFMNCKTSRPSARRQKGLSDISFTCIDRPFCLWADVLRHAFDDKHNTSFIPQCRYAVSYFTSQSLTGHYNNIVHQSKCWFRTNFTSHELQTCIPQHAPHCWHLRTSPRSRIYQQLYRIIMLFGACAYSRKNNVWELIENAGAPILYILRLTSVRPHSNRHMLT